ncbi:hypothetical protein GCM10009123_00170 [Kangiella japonica]|uniref:SCP domain-containing protein n=1 Tax=Kangiella japonica TaxID=647384 RepID=A0ABN0SSY4_9GAMM
MLKSGQAALAVLINLSMLSSAESAELKSPTDSSNIETYEDCGLNQKAQDLAKLIVTDSEQNRSELYCNALLSEVAQNKAEEMAAAGKVSHNGSGGTPNLRLIKAGYPLNLPAEAEGENHVEAILGGYSDPEEVIDMFRNSYYHRIHLFAEDPFFLEQNEIGVGYAAKWFSPHVDYWVVYIAKGNRESINGEPSKSEEDSH